jgi:DNA-binding winged helix-turn-helix (wHTH) protein
VTHEIEELRELLRKKEIEQKSIQKKLGITTISKIGHEIESTLSAIPPALRNASAVASKTIDSMQYGQASPFEMLP